jgi:hypothetical protein
VGLLGGSLAGLIVTLGRKGLGLVRNLGVGVAGALVGGLLFRIGLFPGLDVARCCGRRRRIPSRPYNTLVLAAY